MPKTQFVRSLPRPRRIHPLPVMLLTVGYALATAADPRKSEVVPAADTADQLSASKASHTSQDRLLFPHNWARGYTDFQYAPRHNEVDLGRCVAGTGEFGGAAAPCANFARYMLSGYVELHPFGRTQLRRLFVFAEPKFFFGNNVPRVSYTHSFTPIAFENLMGAGVQLPGNMELRVVNHGVHWMGRYQDRLGAADLGNDGPYGSYATVGVRWYFGGYGATEHRAP